jgi:hypothetical protein
MFYGCGPNRVIPTDTDKSVSMSVGVENAFRSVKLVNLPTLPTWVWLNFFPSNSGRHRPMPTPTLKRWTYARSSERTLLSIVRTYMGGTTGLTA